MTDMTVTDDNAFRPDFTGDEWAVVLDAIKVAMETKIKLDKDTSFRSLSELYRKDVFNLESALRKMFGQK